MKNPYRRKDAKVIRGFLVGTGVVMAGFELTMLGMLLDAMTAPGDVPGMNKMIAGCGGLAVVLLLNGLGMYWVTTKWEWAAEAKWKVLVGLLANGGFVLGSGALAFLGRGIWDGLTAEIIFLILGVTLLVEIAATIAAVMRLREK